MNASQEQSEAQENFKNAFQDFAHVAVSSFGYFMENIEGQVRDTVKNVSSEAIEGVKGIKQELNFTEAVRKNPLPWLAGAAAAGGGSVLLLKILSRGGGSGLRWLLWAGEIGIGILAERKRQAASREQHRAQETQFDHFGG